MDTIDFSKVSNEVLIQSLIWATDETAIQTPEFWKNITPEQWLVKPKHLNRLWKIIFPHFTKADLTRITLVRRNQSPQRKNWRIRKNSTAVGKEALESRNNWRSFISNLINFDTMKEKQKIRFIKKCDSFGITDIQEYRTALELSLPGNLKFNEYMKNKKSYHIDHIFPIDIATANKDLCPALYEFAISVKNIMIIDSISNMRKNDNIILELLPKEIVDSPEFASLNLKVYHKLEDAGLDRTKYENYLLVKTMIAA